MAMIGICQKLGCRLDQSNHGMYWCGVLFILKNYAEKGADITCRIMGIQVMIYLGVAYINITIVQQN